MQVRLKDYGSETVEVADNGTGVAPRDYNSLTLKYHTSKLQSFADLQVSHDMFSQLDKNAACRSSASSLFDL